MKENKEIQDKMKNILETNAKYRKELIDYKDTMEI